jgi:hypothetical protein
MCSSLFFVQSLSSFVIPSHRLVVVMITLVYFYEVLWLDLIDKVLFLED